MEKAVPAFDVRFKDLREAANAINNFAGVLKDKAGAEIKPKIKVIGATKEDILKDFMTAFDSIADVPDAEFPDDRSKDKFPGPKIALDFYNSILDAKEKVEKERVAQEANAATKAAAKAAGKEPDAGKPDKKTGNKTEKPPKTPKVPKEKKENAPKGPGVISSILEFITAGPVTKEQILEKLKARFPEKDADGMKKTIQVQIGGKTNRRMEKEKNVQLAINDKGEYTLADKKPAA